MSAPVEIKSVDLSEFVAPCEVLMLYRRKDGGWTATKSKPFIKRRRDSVTASGSTLEECLCEIQREIDRAKVLKE